MKVFKFVAGSGSNALRAIITAWQWEIDWLVGKEIQFGDETSLVIEARHFTVLSEDATEVSVIDSVIGSFGDCPFDFLTSSQQASLDYASRERRLTLQAAKVERARETYSTALRETFNR